MIILDILVRITITLVGVAVVPATIKGWIQLIKECE